MQMKLEVDRKNLVELAFGADISERPTVGEVRSAVVNRMLTYGLDGCRRYYRLAERDAHERSANDLHNRRLEWYRQQIDRAWPARTTRSRSGVAARTLLEVLATPVENSKPLDE
ncbi:hypothetical protein Cs7R123_32650 [Catellatospora sp. TT07R-123]|uniref:hypothetical protein n=1 Tax=Catellatospora sp. TT07R-123 TaxID=2733863 RepID=UPI001B229CA6|nr:hypothetical protein [Catellatospora sp. TT07R-123]GHJ45923.1 hypothetical protein Cs7R123_32650 [Catellatospora sp. TT07R-123]